MSPSAPGFRELKRVEGNTHLHANDRQGLERLCRYGARGALALERMSRAEDGRIAWRMKRPLPDGTTHLLFTGLELLRRVASLVPPPRANLTRFHGVYAPGAQLRPFLVPQAGVEEASVAPQAVARKEPMKERTPRVDWAELLRRTFDFDVFACARCGGRRRVLAYVTAPDDVGGNSRVITRSSGCGEARYSQSELESLGFNDVVSSFQSYSGCTTTIFEHDDFVGAYYNNGNAGYVGDAMNDRASSIKWN